MTPREYGGLGDPSHFLGVFAQCGFAPLRLGISEQQHVRRLFGLVSFTDLKAHWLTSLVADSQTRTRHNPNRELVGQGLGNLAAGILGALAAILLLALLLGFGWIAEPIPLAVLAGILMKVGWDIVDWRFVLRLRAIRGEYVVIMLLTFLVTVFVDLVTAVALGLIAAGIVRSRDLGRGELDSVLSVPLLDSSDAVDLVDIDPSRVPVGLVKLRGRFSIGSSNDLCRAVSADIEDHDIIILDFSHTTDVDDSAALAIEELWRRAEALDEGDGSDVRTGAHAQSGTADEEGGDRPVDEAQGLGEHCGAGREQKP